MASLPALGGEGRGRRSQLLCNQNTTLLQEYIYFFTVILVAIQEIEGFGGKVQSTGTLSLSHFLTLPRSPSLSF